MMDAELQAQLVRKIRQLEAENKRLKEWFEILAASAAKAGDSNREWVMHHILKGAKSSRKTGDNNG